MGFKRLVKNFVKGENKRRSKEAHGGEIKKHKRKKEKNAFKKMCKIQSEENKDNYKREKSNKKNYQYSNEERLNQK